MNMRKACIPIALVGLLLGCCACSQTSPAEQLDYAYTSVEQLAAESDLIVMGTAESETDADAGDSFYTIKTEKTLRGAEQDEIKLYAFSDLLTLDTQYVLFLQTRDSVFYTEPLVLLTDSDSLITVNADGNVSLPGQYAESYASVEELCDAVSSFPAPETAPASAGTVPDTLPDAELIAGSEIIFAGKITALTYNSAVGAGNAEISITACYKGKVDGDTAACLVPQGLSAGETYLFFRCDGMESMPSRSNSVLPIDSEECRMLMEQLGQIRN